MHDQDMKQHWKELWAEVKKYRKALESGIRGGVSEERRTQLEEDFQVAHRAWWESVSNRRQ